MDPEIRRDLRDRHPWLTILREPEHILAILLGKGFGILTYFQPGNHGQTS